MTIPPAAAQATRVDEVMTRRLVTIGPEQDLVFAHSLMLWSNVRHLPVLKNGDLVGILSDRDLLHDMAERATDPNPTAVVADVMTTPVETAGPDEDLGMAAARMAVKRIDCLPVIDGGKLIGIVSTTDVLAERGRLFFKGGRVDIPSVATVMRKDVEAVHPDDALFDAIRTMVSSHIRHLPVTDSDRRVVGMLSDRDVRAAIGDPLEALTHADHDPQARVVSDAMTSLPMTVRQEASLADLARFLLDERIGALPVVDDDERLVGITSYVDLLAHVIAR
jgi:CBS domain-containing protein